jgi:pSer/pThr/pTyr-binding forkhead associated (FHA) protein
MNCFASPEQANFRRIPAPFLWLQVSKSGLLQVAEELAPVAFVDLRQQTIFRLREGTLLVGRSADCELMLASDAVSRRHAEVRITAGRVRVRDLGSRNGTFINDKPVTEGVVLIGDRLTFGSKTFMLQHVDGIREIEEPETVRGRDEEDGPAAGSRDDLTEAQRRVYDLLIQGKSEKEVANELHLRQNTVHSHVQAIYGVFGVHTRAKLISRALK